MKYIMKQYVVDAFSKDVFHGNQAAVCILDQWLPEELMINITCENNFSETAFAVKEKETENITCAGLRPAGKLTCADTPRWRAPMCFCGSIFRTPIR